MAKSILSQLINKSAGDVANDTLNQALKTKATGPEKVSAAPRRVLSPRGLCSVQAHCEFGAAAAAFALFHPLPRLTASSKPVLVQTTSRERTFIPL